MGGKRFTQQQKLAILESAEKVGMKEAAAMADVHFTTVYDWRRQLEALGKESFFASSVPSPGRGLKKITVEQEESVLSTWRRFPGFGPGQVRNQLRRQRITISIRTVRKIMEANGYQSPRKKSGGKGKDERFEARRPLELAQMDIVEFFINKLKVYLLILLDDFSRFILGWRLLTKTSIDEVISLVQEAINRYGKMEEILTDRGFVFYSWQGANRFERYLALERIDHTHARSHHPQTLGKIEALNGRLKRELLNQEHFNSANEAEGAILRWTHHYNYERTHQGLGGLLVPAERFQGLADQVLSSLGKGIDVDNQSWYASRCIERSIINLMVGPEGNITLYLMGRPICLGGGVYGRAFDSGGSGHSDQSQAAFKG
jgi:transposase InsO family protein